MRGTLVVCTELDSLSREAARRIVEVAAAEAPGPRAFRLALAGGSTPRRLYELLASPEFASRIPWPRTHVFWGDERFLPHDHPDSNYRMAWESLLKHVPIPRENLHPVPTESSPEQAAQAYEQTLRAHFGKRRGIPAFHLILLGLGDDGHTASLFPGAAALEEKERLVATHHPAGGGPARVTLTLPVLNRAEQVFFLVAGADKAGALRAVLEGTGSLVVSGAEPLPAQRVLPRSGKLTWLVDSAAASRLERVRVEPPVVSKAEP